MTRHCQMSVVAAQDWDSVFPLDSYCIVELQFWKNNLCSVNSKTVSDLAFPFISIYSDASNVVKNMCLLISVRHRALIV